MNEPPHSFVSLVIAIANVPQDQQRKFSRLVRPATIQKGKHFVSAGELPKSVAFVKKGLFRYYYPTSEGEELTKGFFPEGNVLSSYSAMVEKRGSYFTIEALEDSAVEIVDFNELQKLFAENTLWSSFLIVLLQKGFIAKEEREREFLLFNAAERYQAFLKRYPNLESRIKQSIVASYIGIAPESLSRLKKSFT